MINILFGAFDAGGGNAIFPIAKNISEDKRFRTLCIIGGPSKRIFENGKIKFIDADLFNESKLNILVENFKPSIFVGGSSAGLTFDKNILSIAKKNKAKTIYILDYWSHYWQRFSGKKKDFKYLPDIICVMDEKSKKEMVEEGFNPNIIKITGNPYFDSFQENIKKNAEEKSKVLFVSQPLAENKDELGYDEFRVLGDLLEVFDNLKTRYELTIRPHPKEKKGKYNKYLNKNIKIDADSLIEKLISKAGLIVGMNSMVLFQASIANKKVISYQPNLKAKDSLISNSLGLSRLVTKKEDLKNLFEQYRNDTWPMTKKEIKNTIITNATQNILDLFVG
ncbi:MAG: polysialyltransferase family glycosyltransferase [Candidatus Paceibacterota bacterium]|jgi:hypothetical protein